jgi:hypothetical protein
MDPANRPNERNGTKAIFARVERVFFVGVMDIFVAPNKGAFHHFFGQRQADATEHGATKHVAGDL